MATDLTQGNIRQQMFSLAWPMTLGIFAIIGFNFVDTYFVSHLGSQELAAMSYTFPVVMTVQSIAIGLSVAMSSLVSRSVGSNQIKKTREITTDGLLFSVLVVLTLTSFGYLSMDFIFRELGAKGTTLELTKSYMGIWFLNIIFVIIPVVGNGAIRATGDTKTPAVVMMIAGVVNLILDPLLIFGLWGFPKLGLQGAAIATVLSRMATLAAAIYILSYREKLIIYQKPQLSRFLENTKIFFKISLPTALSNAIVPLSILLITGLLSQYGDEAVAGFGIGTRLEGVLIVPLFGLSAGLAPFVGQNWGAKNMIRIRRAILECNRISLLWCILCCLFIFIFAPNLISQFSKNPNIISSAHFYIQILCLSFVFEGAMLFVNSALNAIGRARQALGITVVRMVFVYLPCAWMLQQSFEHQGIFIAAAIANVASGIYALRIFNRTMTSQKLFKL